MCVCVAGAFSAVHCNDAKLSPTVRLTLLLCPHPSIHGGFVQMRSMGLALLGSSLNVVPQPILFGLSGLDGGAWSKAAY